MRSYIRHCDFSEDEFHFLSPLSSLDCVLHAPDPLWDEDLPERDLECLHRFG